MNILIASKNESKIKGIKDAFETYFNPVEVYSASVSSGVSKQPKNNEIMDGAINRVNGLINYAKDNNLDIDFYISIEAGLIKEFDKWFNTAVCYIVDKKGISSVGLSSSFIVPDRYVDEILETDLGELTTKVFNKEDKEGTINIITKGVIPRNNLNYNATIMALTTYINGDKWK